MSRFEALYAFHAQQAGDLGFQKGDIITVTAQSGNWWSGSLNGKTGTFPSNYVKPAPAAAAPGFFFFFFLI